MNTGVAAALGSAFLFGVSTPLAKLLTTDINPWWLAGLLYLGSGVGLSLVRMLRSRPQTILAEQGWLWLAAAILCGGVIAPLLMMWGLSILSGSTASLLLNAEAVLTALLAWFVFKENFDRRVALGMAAISIGTIVLSWSGDAQSILADGALAILGACFFWALDNNLTRKVALSDPMQIAALKGVIAGSVNCAIAFAGSGDLPIWHSAIGAALVGFFGYGVSLTLFIVGLRHLGTARAGAYFATAPFVGAVVAVVMLGDPLTPQLMLSAVLMALGVWLHLTERHDHLHTHADLGHHHLHRHDDGHHHHHADPMELASRHVHWHRHEPITHHHRHYPDSHHRHSHSDVMEQP